MKRLIFTTMIVLAAASAFSQDEYEKFVNAQKQQMNQNKQNYQQTLSNMNQEYKDFVDKQNAEFAEFVAKEWQLFNEFKKEQLAMTQPKPEVAPVAAKVAEDVTVVSTEISYKKEEELPKVSHAVSVSYVPEDDNNYELKSKVTAEGPMELKPKQFKDMRRVEDDASTLMVNFYGREVPVAVDQKLRIKSSGIEEKNVAEYFTNIAKCRTETKALWDELSAVVDNFGLNEWGYFCLLREVSEKMFSDVNDRVLFCFYMLRNEGNFKTRVARGKDSGKLTLLVAIDNSKEVYSYTFFRFEDNGKGERPVKYYTVYGGGNAEEPVYTYSFCEQDVNRNEMKLDFDKTLNMGACDVRRQLKLTKDRTVTLPYNKAHMAYLNDVPMTVFPIYFVSPVAIEAQQELQKNFNEMKSEYTPAQFIQMLLHFVQTGFEYKTDEEQFGYEKYFYPEEVIGYPYSDCEDRSAMFAWLVQKYTSAKVIGLQYEGHIATAVWFGDDAEVKGDGFMYGGKKYYVCDPTYINASIGMTMPQFKGKTPKVIKLKK